MAAYLYINLHLMELGKNIRSAVIPTLIYLTTIRATSQNCNIVTNLYIFRSFLFLLLNYNIKFNFINIQRAIVHRYLLQKINTPSGIFAKLIRASLDTKIDGKLYGKWFCVENYEMSAVFR